jgi:hypothetical protein
LKETYSSSEVVLVAELMKVVASMLLIFSDRADSGKLLYYVSLYDSLSFFPLFPL